MLKTTKTNQPIQTDPAASQKNNSSLLGAGVSIKGELTGKEDLVVIGKIKGIINLENNNLIVELEGKIKADIRVRNIHIKGSVEGNIYSTGKVFIEKEGKMIGDISAARISIMEGAQFKGSVKMHSSITS